MATGSERYRGHKVWETLRLKREALLAARYDDIKAEQWREDIVEWLTEAAKTKLALQPALYLSALNELNDALNGLPIETAEFKRYVGVPRAVANQLPVKFLENALRSLPLPPPRDLKASYTTLLDQEVKARTTRLGELEERIVQTEKSLQSRLTELAAVQKSVDGLRAEIQIQRESIKAVAETTEGTIRAEWAAAFTGWRTERVQADSERDAEALAHVASLAATAGAGEALAEHAAGSLTATDWNSRAKRERRAAQWMRAGAGLAIVLAGAVGWFIVSAAIRNDFDLTVGDGILRSTVTIVIAAFGALLLRESSRHFRESDAAEDVALSLKALAPFYAGSGEEVRLAARAQVGDAVLVKNVLSRFAHRDAAKHAGEINTAELPDLVREATQALKGAASEGPKAP